MVEKVSLIVEKAGELQAELQSFFDVEYDVHVHTWIRPKYVLRDIPESEANDFKERLNAAGVEFEDKECFKNIKDISVNFTDKISLSINYEADLLTKKKELEAELLLINRRISVVEHIESEQKPKQEVS